MGRKRDEPDENPETTAGETSRRGGRRSAPASSGSTAEDALGLERDTFTPPEQGDVELGADLDDYESPPPELIEWTPERAAAIVRAGGFMLHTADPLAQEEGGQALWRATADDCETIAPPLARILNRYAPARRLAGLSDEGELAFGLLAYAKRNLAERGRLVRAKREAEAGIGPQPGPGWPERGSTPPES